MTRHVSECCVRGAGSVSRPEHQRCSFVISVVILQKHVYKPLLLFISQTGEKVVNIFLNLFLLCQKIAEYKKNGSERTEYTHLKQERWACTPCCGLPHINLRKCSGMFVYPGEIEATRSQIPLLVLSVAQWFSGLPHINEILIEFRNENILVFFLFYDIRFHLYAETRYTIAGNFTPTSYIWNQYFCLLVKFVILRLCL